MISYIKRLLIILLLKYIERGDSQWSGIKASEIDRVVLLSV